MAIRFTGRVAEVVKRTPTAVDYMSAGESIIAVTNTAAPRTITLANADKDSAKRIEIKDESGGAATNNITIVAETGTIDGAASVAITANYGVARLYSDGTNWFSH